MAAGADIHKRILEALQQHPDGISINELRRELKLASHEHQHLDRRVRDLDDKYEIDRQRHGRETLYVLKGRRATPISAPDIRGPRRAEILWRAQSRCEMCGRSVAEDRVELQVDHRVPRSWGGSDSDDNLWALCSACNRDKRNFFATITDPRIQKAMTHESVHVRLGELLKAYAPQPVPAEYLQLVAHTHDDWQKRLRELRELGWRYRFGKQKDEHGRIRVSFALEHWEPWPESPAAAIREAERQRGKQR